jgi:hypothetical protein
VQADVGDALTADARERLLDAVAGQIRQ